MLAGDVQLAPMTPLGIDIGGSGIKGAPVDTTTGEMLTERERIPTPTPSRPNAVAEVILELIAKFPRATGPIGITFPGVIKNGRTLTAANMDSGWINFEAATFLTAKLGRPVALLNDADAAGLAEMRFGSGRGIRGTVLMLTLGTGIGSALFFDEKLLPNTELGHMEVRGKEAEERASGRVRDEKKLNWTQWGQRVGEVVACYAALLNPDLIIIGGGVSNKGRKFLPLVQEMAKTPVVAAQLQNHAGIVGAALFASQLST